MKKFIFGLSILLSAFVLHADCASASTSDFTINSFKADYYLDRDDEGRSTLKTVEAITAEFPAIDQNHGIERVIPTSYNSHPTSLKVQSITDEKGNNLNYSTSTQNDNLVLRIGDADVYAHGLTNYVITYTQRDITRFYSDTNSDEFYWDVNGTGWSQKFNNVAATIHLGKGLSNSLTGNQSCYYGPLGSTDKCTMIKGDDVISTIPVSLKSGENVTIAVGFKQGTFGDYKMSLIEQLEKYIVYIELFVAISLLTTVCLLKIFKDKGAPGRGTIIAEYLPPKGIDIVLSSIIDCNTTTWAAATYIDLAVKHKVQIIDSGEEKLWKKVYSLKLISTDGLSDIESSVAEALFGSPLVIGSEHQIKAGSDFWLASKLNKIYKQVRKRVDDEGYYINNRKLHFLMGVISAVILIQSILIFFIFVNYASGSIVLLVGIIAASIGFVVLGTSKPFSVKGKELADYLAGLKLYIRVAEADRIKVLQSPQGAAREAVDTNDAKAVLRLYERVLPYAVLFGIESKWVDVLGKYYEQENATPDWYVGNSMFNAALFASTISDFSTSAAASSTYSSSSSGGSSGGGSSGGGGGGGGGGGW